MGLVISANPQDIIICKGPLNNAIRIGSTPEDDIDRRELEQRFQESLIGRGGLYASAYRASYEKACRELEEQYKVKHPTNCKNCGAVLKTNQCEYCKSIY
jgi:methionyl-tRNA synthetase